MPPGVFNLVNGDGPSVGAAMSSHPDVDMVSFTGSTRAGISVAQARPPDGQARHPGARRQVGQHPARRRRLREGRRPTACGACVLNSGQSCNAPTRMLVPHDAHGRGGCHREGGGAKLEGRRSVEAGHHDRPGRLEGAVEQDPGPDQERHRGRRHARRRRPRPAGRLEPRLLREADGVRATSPTT